MRGKLRIKKFIPLFVGILMILLSLWIGFVQKQRALLLYDELAAERYQGEDAKYSQISVFYAQSENKGPADIKEIRNAIMSRLSEDDNIDPDQTGRTFIDAYTGITEAELRKDDNTVTAQVYAVGGDFFMIHPIPLLSGDYLRGDDPYTIVLDDNMAWTLFGSANVAGMKLWIGENIFTVIGVVKTDDGKDARNAYGNYNAVYIPYEAFVKKSNDGDDSNLYDKPVEDAPAIICYEAVVTNPIKSYARGVVAEACGLQEHTDSETRQLRSTLDFSSVELVENTGRYKLPALWKTFKKNRYKSMRTNAVVYPYWENLARLEEQHQIRWKFPAVILFVLPILVLFVWLVSKLRKLTLKQILQVLAWPFKKLYAWVDSFVPEKQETEEQETEEREPDEQEPESEESDPDDPEIGEQEYDPDNPVILRNEVTKDPEIGE